MSAAVAVRASRARPWPRRALAAIGDPVLRGLREAALFTGFVVAVLGQGLRARNWRRTVRAAFGRELREAAVRALPAMLGMAGLIGLGLVSQALHWLEVAGQTGSIGKVIVTVLVREIAPVVVGLLLVGRSGTLALVEVGGMRAGGQLRMLETQGVDPFHILVVPRVAAAAVAGFCLTVLFIVAALLAGFVAGSVVGAVRISLAEFIDRVLAAMGPAEFALVLVKPIIIGAAVSLVCCFTALAATGDPGRAVARGFLRAVLATLLVSGAISVVF